MNPVPEAQGVRMAIESVFNTGSLLYTNFVAVVFLCAALAGLGGLFSALIDRQDYWGSDPRRPEDWLFHLPAYLLTISGALSLLVTVAVLRQLWGKSLTSLNQLQEQYSVQTSISYPAGLYFLLGYLAGLVFLLLPLGITWGWIIRRWYVREQPGGWAVIWIFVTTLFIAFFTVDYAGESTLSPPIDLMLLGLAFVLGLVLGLMTRERSEGFPYRFSDWFGFALTFGILAGTQIVMGVAAYAFTIALLTITNIPHLVRGEALTESPAAQVLRLIYLQNGIAQSLILGSLFVGVVLASLVSFLRTLLGIRDVPPEPARRKRVYHRR
jgi:hypothetical protein